MRVAVIGAGVTGLVAAHRLGKSGHAVDVYERWPGLGGQAATLDVGGGHLLERYYHHLFTSDRHIAELYEELGLAGELERRPSRVAFFVDGARHAFNGPIDLLRFSPLRIRDRLRMGIAVLRLQRRGRLEDFEDVTARDWITSNMGQACWDRVWGPLLRGKFGSRHEDISMAWIWSKLTVRRSIRGEEARQEMLVYPGSSFETLFARLREEIEAAGGRVMIDRPAARLDRAGAGIAVQPGAPGSFRSGQDPRAFAAAGEPEAYDAVLATVPSDIFEQFLSPRLAGEVGEEYLRRARSIDYHEALCLVLETDRAVTADYWTNVADRDLPFVGLVEHTNLIEAERYDGRHFLYVANYLEHGDPLLALDADGLLRLYEPGLLRVNPRFSLSWVRQRWLFREPAAQPIVDVGYADRMPPLATGAPGLVLANTTQIYPEDRGTNYSVRLGEQAAIEVERTAGAAT